MQVATIPNNEAQSSGENHNNPCVRKDKWHRQRIACYYPYKRKDFYAISEIANDIKNQYAQMHRCHDVGNGQQQADR